MKQHLRQNDGAELLEDLNPLVKGMKGVILDIYDHGKAFEVEFFKKDGTNYSYEKQSTFTIPANKLKKIYSAKGNFLTKFLKNYKIHRLLKKYNEKKSSSK